MAKEKYLIMRDRKRIGIAPLCWNPISHTSLAAKKLYKTGITIEWMVSKDGRARTIFMKDNWSRVANIISEKLLKEKGYFERLQKRLKIEAIKMEKFLQRMKKENISKLRYNELINLANKIKKMWLDYDVINVYAWYIGGDEFKEKIDKLLNLSHEEFLFLTTPTEKTEVSKLEYELLKYTKLIKKGKSDLGKTAEKLSNSYSWIPLGYDGLEYWDKNHFVNELKKKVKNYSEKIDKEIELIKKTDKENLKKRDEIIKKHKLNKQQLNLIDIINVLAIWTDERKKLEFPLHYYYSQILLEIERRYNIPYKNLKYLFTEELSNIEKNRDNILEISNRRINSEFMVEFKNERRSIVSEKEKDTILKELEKQIKRVGIDIKGMIASKGTKSIYRGIVKVLFSPKEGSKVKNGDFLAATMTSPDYITAMKKAIGFITDEGGVTCHAAIVAREMKKPCIIGTKIATKVLKDGDLVEVDANKGIVRKIK